MNGVQTYRNPKLVNVFDKLKYIENFKTGICRTMAAYKKTGFSPLFEASNNFFTVTLPNLNGQLSVADDKITLDRIRNKLKRELKPYVRFVGSNKTGGYYLELV